MILTDFLLARIAEDESDARSMDGLREPNINLDRVLTECEAKRRIMAAHLPFAGSCDTCHELDGPDAWPCLTLRILASVYADHPDYREEWRT